MIGGKALVDRCQNDWLVAATRLEIKTVYYPIVNYADYGVSGSNVDIENVVKSCSLEN